MARALIVEIFGDAKQFAAELDKAAGKTRQLGKAAGVAGLAIAGGLALGLDKSVKAAIAAQEEQGKLNQAFTNAGLNAAKLTGKTAQLEAANRKLGFTNNDTRESLTKLVTAGDSVTKATTDMSIAADLARYKQISLGEATTALIKIHAGNARALKEVGIVMPAVTSAADALTEQHKALSKEEQKATQSTYAHELALAKVQDKLSTGAQAAQLLSDKIKGQGEEFSKTAEGGAAQFHAQLGNLEESLGKGLLPALTQVSQAVASLTEFFARHTTATKVLIGALASLAAGLLAVNVATKLVAAAQAIMTAAQWALNVALDANPIGIAVLALAALAAAIVVAYKHSQTFRDIVQDAFAVVRSSVQAVVNVIQTLRDVASSVFGFFERVVKAAAGVISGSVGGIIGDFNAVIGVLRAVEGAASAAFNAVKSVTGIGAPDVTVPQGSGNLGRARGNIHHYAKGGIVPGALGAPQLAVVHGGETVVPAGGFGGGQTINVYVAGSVLSANDLVSVLRNASASFGRFNVRSAF